jgi:hypothetical protein
MTLARKVWLVGPSHTGILDAMQKRIVRTFEKLIAIILEVIVQVPKGIQWIIREAWIVTQVRFSQDRAHVLLVRYRFRAEMVNNHA